MVVKINFIDGCILFVYNICIFNVFFSREFYFFFGYRYNNCKKRNKLNFCLRDSKIGVFSNSWCEFLFLEEMMRWK